MKWSDEKLWANIYDAIVFDEDEDIAIELIEKGIKEDTINIDETDQEGNTFIYYALLSGLDRVVEFLRKNNAFED